ncbi:MAG: tRNA 2-thiouridine(34) synthase MnmA [Clostridia bacterium]|nr:tRNA 2-thiouridine(34) synthase MnmA [Clostridia bacterium]
MSGGVDSSVAALLLKEQGHDVVGVFMKNWEDDDRDGVCAAEDDYRDVRSVCDLIGIPYYSVNFAGEYWDRVFRLFLEEYSRGRTPNPDVLCNREIKFKAFLDFALRLGGNKIATGHFVRTDGEGRLLKGTDSAKDQSYFLYMLKSGQLKKSVFPVGAMTKAEVRSIARDRGLRVSEKKDSTGVCFIGERNFRQFLKNYLPARPGDMVTDRGEIVGRHDGLMYYTLGQRRGLGIGGRGDGRSFFVVDKDLANNRLIVAQGEDHPFLFSRGCVCSQATFILDEVPENVPVSLACRFRYRQGDQKVTVRRQGDEMEIIADVKQRALTPGQSAVLYDGDVCLGGGIIDTVLR